MYASGCIDSMNVDAHKLDRTGTAILRHLLICFAFTLPISISIAQPLAYLAIPLGICIFIWRRDRSIFANPFFWPVLSFILLMLLAAWMGPSPAYSIPRSRRLLLSVLIFIIPAAFDLRANRLHESILMPLLAFVAGATCLGLWDLIRIPLQVRQGIALYDTGNMRDPQLYLVSFSFVLALWLYRPIRSNRWLLIGASAINLLGVVLHFKRGVWISLAVSILVLAGLTRRYRLLGYLMFGLAFSMVFPQVRDRVNLLHEEFNLRTGGRMVLWTEVAPELIRQFPVGAGFRSLEHADFAQVTPHYVQPGLNHLHNNLLQVTVDAGWLGGAVWLYWMLLTWLMLARSGIRYRQGPPIHAVIALGGVAAFTGLMVNGLIEYNFGNSVIFMVLMLLMGVTAALHQHTVCNGLDLPSS